MGYRSLSRFRLLIKNNLTHIHSVRLRGVGGRSEIFITEVRTLLNKASIPFFSSVLIPIITQYQYRVYIIMLAKARQRERKDRAQVRAA